MRANGVGACYNPFMLKPILRLSRHTFARVLSLGLLSACQGNEAIATAPAAQPALHTLNQPAARTGAPCIPQFPYQNGWLGGDGAYSVPLSPTQSVWLFGDTFIGPNPTRAGSGMVANSIGVSQCDPTGFRIQYFAGLPAKNQPQPFFKATADKYWPIHGFVHNHKLYVALEQVATNAQEPDNTFGFAIVGVTLAEIANYQAPPPQWQIRYRELSRTKAAIPGIAMVKKDGHLYMLTVKETKEHPVLLNRLALDKLNNPMAELEYLGANKTWKKGLLGEDATVLVKQAATEISLHYDAQRRQWVMVHTHPAFFSKDVVIRQAPTLEGPWEQKVSTLPLYQEMTPQDPHYDPETFCYAAKAHPQFNPGKPDTLVVTYACNSLNFGKLLQQMAWYYPVVKLLPLPK